MHARSCRVNCIPAAAICRSFTHVVLMVQTREETGPSPVVVEKANSTRRICMSNLMSSRACPQKSDNQYRTKTHRSPDQINTTLTPVWIVRPADSLASPPSSATVIRGPENDVSNCLAIICGNSSEGNSFDDSSVQPLELQMANVEIMEISMARNTDAKSSTVKPVWSSVILSSSDVV